MERKKRDQAKQSIPPDLKTHATAGRLDRLRRPLCKCKGVGGRTPICGRSTGIALNPFGGGGVGGGGGSVDGSGGSDFGIGVGSGSAMGHVAKVKTTPRATGATTTAPPCWNSLSKKEVDAEAVLIRYQHNGGKPLFVDSVYLYEDDLHESVGY